MITFAIPTSTGRANILKENLELLIKNIKNYNFKIFISDNSLNKEAENVVSNLQQSYSNIFYYNDPNNSDADRNIANSLKLSVNNSDSKYIWLIGDTTIITNNLIEKIINTIDKQDFLMLNAENRVKDVPDMLYTDPNSLLKDLGWHLTSIGTTIYTRKSIEMFNFERYYDTSFIQLAIIFEYASKSIFKEALWLSESNIHINQKKTSSWSKVPYDVFSERWVNLVFSLPSYYSLENKLICIKKHDFYTKLFSFTQVIKYRQKGLLDIKLLKKYKNSIQLSSNLPYFLLYLISITPIMPTKLINILKSLKKA